MPITGANEVPVRFTIGDALELAEPNSTFDTVRSERTLQWLTDPSSRRRDGPCDYGQAASCHSSRPIGRRSTSTSATATSPSEFTTPCRSSDAERLTSGAASLTSSTTSDLNWWIKRRPHSVGLLGIPTSHQLPRDLFDTSLAEDLIDAGQLGADDRDRFVSTIDSAACEGRFSMALTMFGVVAVASRSAP